MKSVRCFLPVLFLLLFAFRDSGAQTVFELTTADEGGADIGLYNDNQRGAFTNQDGSFLFFANLQIFFEILSTFEYSCI